MARNIAIFTVLQAQQQAAKNAAAKNNEAAQGTSVDAGNTAGQVNKPSQTLVYGVGGETSAYSSGLLTLKKGKKEASKLGTNNYAMVDEHQGQVFLG